MCFIMNVYSFFSSSSFNVSRVSFEYNEHPFLVRLVINPVSIKGARERPKCTTPFAVNLLFIQNVS